MKIFTCSLAFISLSLIIISMSSSKETFPVIPSELLYDSQSSLGEGAFWNHQTQTFWWVDILGKQLHIYDPATENNTSYTMPQLIGTVVPDQDGNAIVALQDGIYRFYFQDESLELLAKADHDPNKFRFNDGKCDPAGRLWVGSISMDGSKETAALYRMDTDYTLKRVWEGITISNGIVWSADNTRMYYIDTPTQQVKEFNYDNETGDITFSRVAVEIQHELGSPDGMAIDENNNLWIGHWGGLAVYCWDPVSGDLITKVDVAAKNVTSCAFSGENLDQLIITTASVGMSDEEKNNLTDSGGLFLAIPGVKGVLSPFFGKPE